MRGGIIGEISWSTLQKLILFPNGIGAFLKAVENSII